MNLIENIIKIFSPTKALEREKSRLVLDNLVYKREYEASKINRLRKRSRDLGDGDAVMFKAGNRIRTQARYLDENHDLAKGILDTLVNKVIGTGITIEPQVKNLDGNSNKEFNNQLLDLFNDWAVYPDVTGELHWNTAQRLIARTLFRDGEVLIRKLEGNIKQLDHKSVVPFSIELIEPDLLPLDLNDENKNIISGVQKNKWNEPINYYLYSVHPGTMINYKYKSKYDYKIIKANEILHPKLVYRINQTRGISIFASVMNRLEDIKEYEESERVASKVAAAMCAYIRKPSDGIVDETSKDERLLKMQPGMIFDNLLPGEEIGMLDPKRPNTMIEVFLKAQLRCVASGTYTNYSTISKDYNGTYSAQRQELVENKVNYDVLTDYLVYSTIKPIYKSFVKMAILSNKIKVPPKIKETTLYDADFRGAITQWIDPLKEIQAEELSVQAGFKSRNQVIRERGYNPSYVLEQIKQEQEEEKVNKLKFSTTLAGVDNLTPTIDKKLFDNNLDKGLGFRI